MIFMLLFGAMNTLVMKGMDDTVLRHDKDGKPIKFNHPYFQGSIMFLGEFTCLFVYLIKIYCFKPAAEEKKDEEEE